MVDSWFDNEDSLRTAIYLASYFLFLFIIGIFSAVNRINKIHFVEKLRLEEELHPSHKRNASDKRSSNNGNTSYITKISRAGSDSPNDDKTPSNEDAPKLGASNLAVPGGATGGTGDFHYTNMAGVMNTSRILSISDNIPHPDPTRITSLGSFGGADEAPPANFRLESVELVLTPVTTDREHNLDKTLESLGMNEIGSTQVKHGASSSSNDTNNIGTIFKMNFVQS